MKRVLTITPTNIIIASADSYRLIIALESFYGSFATTSVTFDKTANVTPRQYLYKVVAQDGRVWKQTVVCDNPPDPVMTFQMTDQWRLSEFSSQQNLRDVLITFANKYPAVDKITYTFT